MDRREQGFLGFSINGITLGDQMDVRKIEEKVGSGEWIETEHYKKFAVRNNGIKLSFTCPNGEAELASNTVGPDMPKSKTPNSAPTE